MKQALLYLERLKDHLIFGIGAGGCHYAQGADRCGWVYGCPAVGKVGYAGELLAVVTYLYISVQEVAATEVYMARLSLYLAALEWLGKSVFDPIASLASACGAGYGVCIFGSVGDRRLGSARY